MSLPKLPRRPRQHYLLELEHSRHPGGLKDKLARYDALITGWGRTQEPFLSAGLPPAVIFVFPDERMALAVAKLADAARARADRVARGSPAGVAVSRPQADVLLRRARRPLGSLRAACFRAAARRGGRRSA